MSYDWYCSVALPHGAVGLSAVCNCGIFLIILAFFVLYNAIFTKKSSYACNERFV